MTSIEGTHDVYAFIPRARSDRSASHYRIAVRYPTDRDRGAQRLGPVGTAPTVPNQRDNAGHCHFEPSSGVVRRARRKVVGFRSILALRFHYLAVAAVAAIWLVTNRHYYFLAILVSATALNVSVLMHGERAATTSSDGVENRPLRVLTLNLRWSNRTPEKAARYIKRSGAHFVVLQEAVPRLHPVIESLRGTYPHIAPPNWRRNTQNIVLSKHQIISSRLVFATQIPLDVNFLVADARLGTQTVRVIAVHPPYPLGGRYAELHKRHLLAYAHEARSYAGPTLLVGDFNTTPWSPRFGRMLRDGGLRVADLGLVWPQTFPTGSRNIVFRYLPVGIPIDHIAFSRHFEVTRISRGNDIGSDHYPVVGDLVLKPN